MRGVAAVDFLDDALAPVAAGEIEIDVGPAFAALAEESLEEKSAADGIAGGDAEAVANGAVGRAAAALDEDAGLAGEIDDAPDDEEVALEAEFVDDVEFVIELLADFRREFSVATAGTGVGFAAEHGGHGVAFFDGIVRELVAEVFEGEIDFFGDALGVC